MRLNSLYDLCRKLLFLSLPCRSALAHTQNEAADKLNTLLRRDDCQTNPDWHATQAAWIADDTDKNLATWWQNVSANPHKSFANELGAGFGAHLNGFECGIGAYSTCIAPSCGDYQVNSNPAWSYLAILSVVNLNQFFNAIYIGISNGQTDYSALTNDLANVFFPWKDPKFIFGDVAFWIVAIVTAVLAIPTIVGEIAVEVAVGAIAVSSFAGAGIQEVSSSLQPDPISSQLTQSQGLAKLNVFAEQVGSGARQNVESWANATMYGEKDSSDKSILDYVYNGSFAGGGLPTFTDIEQYYKKQMVSRTINAQWKKQKIFITFFKTDNVNDASGPNQTRYYSTEDGGVYYMYRYTEDGVLRGHLDKPWGLDYLNGTTYGITGNDITKASARAFRVGGFSYTQDMAQERLVSSMSSNGTLTPFKDGAGWEGTWTLAVCDMGTHNWNTQFGNKTSRYGVLPCCCGPNCVDTKNFTDAANLHSFQTLLRGCKAQLKNSDINYKDVNYGFGWQKSFPLFWATLSMGQKAGMALAIVFGSLSVSLLCCACCAG